MPLHSRSCAFVSLVTVATVLASGLTVSAATAATEPAAPSIRTAPTPAVKHRALRPGAEPSGPAHRDTSTVGLLKAAGLKRVSATTAAKTGDVQLGKVPGTANSLYTASDPTKLVPTISRHVDPSCSGTGTDGNRVQVIYLHDATTSRYATVLPAIQNELKTVDDVFAVSAAETGGGRRVRWVHDSDCVPTVLDVTVPTASLSGTLQGSMAAVRALGYNRADRKYLMFADVAVGGLSDGACGQAMTLVDSSPTGNANDGAQAQFARIDDACWVRGGYSYAAHELIHTLGAVQGGAPHATKYGHCYDQYDLMCYNDGSQIPMQQVCPVSHEDFLDCNNDDYFSTNPVAGSYLATHWNIANSSFLDTVTPLSSAPSLNVSVDKPYADAGDNFTFTSAASPGATVTWTPLTTTCGGTGTGTTYVMNCPANASGYQDVTVTADNGQGRTTQTISRVLVVATSAPVITRQTPTEALAGLEYTVSVNSSGGKGPFTYQWTNNSPTCTTAGPLTQASLRVTCPTSMIGADASQTLQVTTGDRRVLTYQYSVPISRPAATVTVNTPTQVVEGSTSTLTATLINAGDSPTVTWWSANGYVTGNGLTATLSIPANTYGLTADHLRVTVRTADGYNNYTDYTYTIGKRLTLSLTGPNTLVQGGSALFTATTNTAATVAYTSDTSACTFGAVNAAKAATLTCSGSFTGPVHVSATATDATGQTATVDQTVAVTTASPHLTMTAPTSAESGRPFAATVENTGASAATWTWVVSDPDCQTSVATRTATVTCPYAVSGPVTVTATGTTVDGHAASVTEAVTMTQPSVAYTLRVAQNGPVYHGSVIDLVGTGTDLEGDGLAGTYTFEASSDDGTTWEPVASVSSTTGTPTARVTADRSTAYRVRLAGAATVSAMSSLSVAARPVVATLSSTGGYPVTFVGGFHDGISREPIVGADVRLQVRWNGAGPWVDLGLVRTSSTGAATTAYELATTRFGVFRMAMTDADHPTEVGTGTRTVRNATEVAGSVGRGSPTRLTATLSYASGAPLAGQRVTLQKRYAGRPWSEVGRYRTGSTGKVTVTARPGRRTGYRWVFPATTVYLGSTSATGYAR